MFPVAAVSHCAGEPVSESESSQSESSKKLADASLERSESTEASKRTLRSVITRLSAILERRTAVSENHYSDTPKNAVITVTIKFEQSKKISNDQELIQSDPTSCPQNQKGNN